ncbi:methyl-accepting chemotaxis protein [Reichenbachiella versicolor]|uniref:methyl-accepting chemotaxis protein n=1 Tax=Reichenbachiella versicolor TaxID=1821036 RepID=UPI000D6DEB8F|nr:methyl-accepting chemotaxis protein [Reichenbachiella versicolor]
MSTDQKSGEDKRRLVSIRNLSLKLKLTFGALLFLSFSILNSFLISHYKELQKADGVVIDLAGRQRMLSQRIGLLAFQYQMDSSTAEELQKVIQLCDTSLEVLKNGGKAPAMNESMILPPTTGESLNVLLAAEGSWRDYKLNAQKVMSQDSMAIVSSLQHLKTNAQPMLAKFNNLVKAYVKSSKQKQQRLTDLLLLFLVINVVLVVLMYLLSSIVVVKPIDRMKTIIEKLSQGKLNNQVKIRANDEIGQAMMQLQKLDQNLSKVAKMATYISEGNLDTEYSLLSGEDELGRALIDMQSKLKLVLDEMREVVYEAVEYGNFKTLIQEQGKSGGWLIMTSSINSLLQSISYPLVDLKELMNKVADGDFSQAYKGNAKGQIKDLTDALNSSLSKLSETMNHIMQNAEEVSQQSSEIQDYSSQMNTATSEIAIATSQMSEGAHDQVVKIEQASRMIEDIKQSTERVNEKSNHIHETATQGVGMSEDGKRLSSDMKQVIDTIAGSFDQTNSSMKLLMDRSNDINRVLRVISEIASQTNLLALNAAIEAAQAGDSGRGFAVVAEEIRKLAEDSRKSAKEIEQLVGAVITNTTDTNNLLSGMTENVEKGVHVAKELSDVFDAFNEVSQETLKNSEEIKVATDIQTDYVKEVVYKTESVIVIAEETAAGTEQTMTSTQQLATGMEQLKYNSQTFNGIAESLKKELGEFKLMGEIDERHLVEVA